MTDTNDAHRGNGNENAGNEKIATLEELAEKLEELGLVNVTLELRRTLVRWCVTIVVINDDENGMSLDGMGHPAIIVGKGESIQIVLESETADGAIFKALDQMRERKPDVTPLHMTISRVIDWPGHISDANAVVPVEMIWTNVDDDDIPPPAATLLCRECGRGGDPGCSQQKNFLHIRPTEVTP